MTSRGEKYSFNLDECLVINVSLCGYFAIRIYLENIDLRVRTGPAWIIRVPCIDTDMKSPSSSFGTKCGTGDIVVISILSNIQNQI